jgi:C4-type Zn-finger protein
MDKKSRRAKIGGLVNAKKVDLSNWYKNRKKAEEAEWKRRAEEKELEEKRINSIICPCCKSKEKIHHIKRENNGVCGPGYNSWVTEDYLICKDCGIHYSDVEKLKK